MEGGFSTLRAEMSGQREEIKALVNTFQGKIDKLAVRLIMWFVGTLIGVAGIAIACLKAPIWTAQAGM
jgi:hypothetical protein